MTSNKRNNNENFSIKGMVNFILNMFKLLHTGLSNFAKVERKERFESLDISDKPFKKHLTRVLIDKFGNVPPKNVIDAAIDYIDDTAEDLGVREGALRVVREDDTIFVDNVDKTVVKITADGFSVVPDTYNFFLNNRDQLPQVHPKKGEKGLDDLRELFNVSDNDWLLIKYFIASAFNSRHSMPILILIGAAGTGKSTQGDMIKRITDNSMHLREKLKNTRDMKVRIANNYLTYFDNVSKLTSDQSDLLCGVSTGMSDTERELYTNNRTQSFNVKRPICMSGIKDFVTEEDMSTRSLFVRTLPIRKGQDIDDDDIYRKFEEILPYALDDIYTLVSAGLCAESKVKRQSPTRFAAWHNFVYGMAEADGGKGAEFEKALKENIGNYMSVKYGNHSLIKATRRFMSVHTQWFGRSLDVWGKLKSLADSDNNRKLQKTDNDDNNKFPVSNVIMMKDFNKLAPVLKFFDITVERAKDPTSDNYSYIKITNDGKVAEALLAALDEYLNEKYNRNWHGESKSFIGRFREYFYTHYEDEEISFPENDEEVIDKIVKASKSGNLDYAVGLYQEDGQQHISFTSKTLFEDKTYFDASLRKAIIKPEDLTEIGEEEIDEEVLEELKVRAKPVLRQSKDKRQARAIYKTILPPKEIIRKAILPAKR